MTSHSVKEFDAATGVGATSKNAVAKLVKAWESKNGQRAVRGSGLGLMAVTLAACGGSDTTTTTPTTPTAPVVTPVSLALTTGNDLFDSADFTSSADTVTGTSATYGSADVIADATSGDGDTLTVSTAVSITATPIVVGIENIVFDVTSFTARSIAVDNIASGTVTVNNLQLAGATAATVTGAGGITVVAGAGVTTAFSVTAAEGLSPVINSGSAATLNVTDAGEEGVSIVAGSSTTAINVEGDGDTSDAGVANDTVAISAVGAVALNTNSDGTNTDQVENITLSGNGGAVVFTLNASDAIESVAFTGAHNVTLAGAAADFTTETFANTSTGVATLRITDDSTSNLSNVATSIVIDVADGTTGGATYTLANNANVLLTNAAAQTFNSTALTSGDETINLTVQVDGTGAAVNVSDFEIVNVSTLTPTSLTGAMDLELVAGASSVVTLTGSVALALDTASVADRLNASTYAGVITMTTTAANINDLSFGTANDVITVTSGETVTINGGAGTDTLVAAADMDTTSFSNFEILDATTAITNIDSSQLVFALTIINGDVTVDNANTAVIDLSVHTVDTSVNFTVTGALDTTVFATTQGLTITGNVNADTLTGTANADVIRGGAGDDIITGGAGADVLTGGAGADKFVYHTADHSTATSMDVISDFAAATDILSFDTTDDAHTVNDATVAGDVANEFLNGMATGALATAIAADTSFADALAEFLAASSFADNDVAGFIYGGSTYVVHADAANAAGNIVMLEGVQLVSITEVVSGANALDTFTGAIA